VNRVLNLLLVGAAGSYLFYQLIAQLNHMLKNKSKNNKTKSSKNNLSDLNFNHRSSDCDNNDIMSQMKRISSQFWHVLGWNQTNISEASSVSCKYSKLKTQSDNDRDHEYDDQDNVTFTCVPTLSNHDPVDAMQDDSSIPDLDLPSSSSSHSSH